MALTRRRLRMSKTLIVQPSGRGIVCIDYVSKSAVTCETDTLYWLSCFRTWKHPSEVVRLNPQVDAASLRQQIEILRSLNLLLVEGSAAAKRQDDIGQNWTFGIAAAVLHFSCMNGEFMDLDNSEAVQLKQLANTPSPPLTWSPDKKAIGKNPSTPCEVAPEAIPLLGLMAARRSQRVPTPAAITKVELMTCMLAGLGVTGFTRTAVARLPLKMTPSGGARNPYEGIVFANRVEGLARGFYRFSAVDGSLTLVKRSRTLVGSKLLAGQDWGADMPAIVILTAFMERTMWKYDDPNAYRVVLIEAGHIAQNMMLSATHLGLATCPTAALDHDLISGALSLKSVTQVPIYAVALCRSTADNIQIEPNLSLPLGLGPMSTAMRD